MENNTNSLDNYIAFPTNQLIGDVILIDWMEAQKKYQINEFDIFND